MAGRKTTKRLDWEETSTLQAISCARREISIQDPPQETDRVRPVGSANHRVRESTWTVTNGVVGVAVESSPRASQGELNPRSDPATSRQCCCPLWRVAGRGRRLGLRRPGPGWPVAVQGLPNQAVSVVVLPCRHLCLCEGCGDAGAGQSCPVCDCVGSGSVGVFLCWP